MPPQSAIAVQVVAADVLAFQADVLALKFAQDLYGADASVFGRLTPEQRNREMPPPGGFVLHDTSATLGVRKVMFLGVQPLGQFGYAEIREFGRRVCTVLAREAADVEHIALTIHGPGFGLDEVEAFESALAGIVEAVSNAEFPKGLRKVSFVERSLGRARRLAAALVHLLPEGQLEVSARGPLSALAAQAQTTLRSVGYASAAKPRVFVAMSFASEMDDTFHYGIQGATNAAGMLCERADLSAFTGDVIDWVKTRISTARFVIADLSSANPNVYLEVGYAWGRNVPTVLLCKEAADLKFDVKGQRCIVYKSIKHLEESLARELKALGSSPLG